MVEKNKKIKIGATKSYGMASLGIVNDTKYHKQRIGSCGLTITLHYLISVGHSCSLET